MGDYLEGAVGGEVELVDAGVDDDLVDDGARLDVLLGRLVPGDLLVVESL